MHLFTRLLVILFLSFGSTLAQRKLSHKASSEVFPVPAPSANRLFYIQRSSNINTIMYDANLLPNRKLNPEQPVLAYWIRYAEGSVRKELNYIQQTLAYGVDFKPIANETGSYEVVVVSYKKRKIKVSLDAKGNPIALININGKPQQFHHVFVQVEETGHLIPKILYVDIFGRDLKTGAEVIERFVP